MQTAVLTIVSKNYLHFARTLMQSVASVHPEWDRFVLLVDEIQGDFDPENEAFKVVEVGQLPLPEKEKLFFRYTILELNTAVKPWMMEWLAESQGYDQVVYLDPDIFVYRRLDEVEKALADGAMIVVTPHLTGPLNDGKRPSELDIMRAGSFNLGFIAVRRCSKLLDFLRWWQQKLEFDCVVDWEAGLFVDQKWIDLVPGMFADVHILRHEGYNVAYWNIKHRVVKDTGCGLTVNGQPLVFFHFSGINPKSPSRFSKHQNRFSLRNIGAVKTLARDYCRQVIGNGLDTCTKWDYVFGRFSDGTAIPDQLRYCYRSRKDCQVVAGKDPFMSPGAFNEPWKPDGIGSPPITILMHFTWTSRADLQRAFPDIVGSDRIRFAQWFLATAAVEYGLPRRFVEPLEACGLSERSGLRAAAEDTKVGGGDIHWRIADFLRFWDVDFVVNAYRVILGRLPDDLGLNQYVALLRKGRSRIELLGALRYSNEGRAGGVRIRGLALLYPIVRLNRILTLARNKYEKTFGMGGRGYDLGDRYPAEAAQEYMGSGNRDVVGYSGFYELEDGARSVWIGQSASIRLPRYEPGVLTIRGEYEAEYQRKANDIDTMPLAVGIDGEIVGTIEVSDAGAFEKVVHLPERGRHGAAVLTLEPRYSFVPADIGVNEDRRELSVRISSVSLNGKGILDFGLPDSPYVANKELLNGADIGMNIVGYARSEHGVGQSARLCASVASAAGIPFSIFDFNVGSSSRAEDDTWLHKIGTETPYAVNVFHINADQMPVAQASLGREFFRKHYNVGFWHWELPEFPDRFMTGFLLLNEVWVPSHFVLDSVSAKSPVPVVRMPHPIWFKPDASVSRSQMGLPDRMFLFLSMYDMHSYQERKNPMAAIKAFRLAFRDRKDVGLVVKLQNAQTFPEDLQKLKENLDGASNIFLISETLSRQGVYNLESLCDCFVSLHRSEGFGLGLAECMYLGKPVIGTNWSGNVDFMNQQNSCLVDFQLVPLEKDYGPYKKGQIWAEPDVEHAAWYMRLLANDKTCREHIAAHGQKTILNDFSPENVGRLYKARLGMIARYLM